VNPFTAVVSTFLILLSASPTIVGSEARLGTGIDTSRPNIVVLMLDDMPPMPELISRMPNVAALFGNGVTFTNYYGNDPLCCPGRAAFFTGQYSHHHHVTSNDGRPFDPSMTIATQLHGAGYYTMIAGKYLNGLKRFPDKTPIGWDRTAIFTGGYYDYEMWVDGRHEKHGWRASDYSTDVVADKAMRMLGNAPADQPVFLELAPFAVHHGKPAPRGMPAVAERHKGDLRCTGIGDRVTGSYDEADTSDKPTFLRDLPHVRYPAGWPLQMPCEALLSVDEMFGRVRRLLAAQGRTNTLFVLTADNGMAWGDHRWQAKQVSYATPIPLRVRWNGHDGGARTVTDYVTNVDLAPTLAAVGGTSLGPFPNGQTRPDGTDVSALITGGTGPPRTGLLEERAQIVRKGHPTLPGWYAIRTTDRHALGLWHYVEWTDGQRELYDLRTDPDELQNIAGRPQDAAIEAELSAELLSLRSSTP
jgi:N-acetylglucosamine-6-sulfatase